MRLKKNSCTQHAPSYPVLHQTLTKKSYTCCKSYHQNIAIKHYQVSKCRPRFFQLLKMLTFIVLQTVVSFLSNYENCIQNVAMRDQNDTFYHSFPAFYAFQ